VAIVGGTNPVGGTPTFGPSGSVFIDGGFGKAAPDETDERAPLDSPADWRRSSEAGRPGCDDRSMTESLFLLPG
jgi:hypothetical protein